MKIEVHIFFNGFQNQFWLQYFDIALGEVRRRINLNFPTKIFNTTKRAEVEQIRNLYLDSLPDPRIAEMVFVEVQTNGKYKILEVVLPDKNTYDANIVESARTQTTFQRTLEAIERINILDQKELEQLINPSKKESGFNWWLIGGLAVVGAAFYISSKN